MKPSKLLVTNSSINLPKHLHKLVCKLSHAVFILIVPSSSLSKSVMRCIDSCIRNTAGAENFRNTVASRQQALDTYLEKTKLYDTREKELEAEYAQLVTKRTNLKGKTAMVKLDIESLNHQISQNTALKKNLEQTVNQLAHSTTQHVKCSKTCKLI